MGWLEEKYPGLAQFREGLESTSQNPAFHGEGDVWSHTRLVLERLGELEGYRGLPEDGREAVALAAALHDVGKPKTTRMEEGAWTSPRHAAVGAHIAREFLWRECGLCGNAAGQRLREAVCALVRRHGLPLHAVDGDDGLFQLARFAESPATVKQLCLLSEADALGRIAPDVGELCERVRLCALLAEENGVLDAPMAFASPVTKRAWFSGRDVHPTTPLYDDAWGEVVLMSGLAGVGKDTWIANHFDLPVISLDAIRREMKIPPTKNQHPVVREARERARELLRRRQPFIWNATDLTRRVREGQIALFEQYGAAVRIVYLETDWETNVARNRNRDMAVPDGIVEKMLSILEPPMPWEAREVEWMQS